jgi:hypothetical protein
MDTPSSVSPFLTVVNAERGLSRDTRPPEAIGSAASPARGGETLGGRSVALAIAGFVATASGVRGLVRAALSVTSGDELVFDLASRPGLPGTGRELARGGSR